VSISLWGILVCALVTVRGAPDLVLYFGVTFSLIVLFANFDSLPASAKRLLALTLLLALFTATQGLLSTKVLHSSVISGLSLGGFLLSLQFLAPAIERSTLVETVGRIFIRQPPGRRYYGISAGVNMLGMLLSISVIPVFLTMVRRTLEEAQREIDAHVTRQVQNVITKRSAAATMRGLSMVPLWSPVSVVVVIISTRIPDMDWIDYLPLGALVAVLLVFVGRLVDWFQYKSVTPLQGFRTPVEIAPLVLLFLILASVPAITWAVTALHGGSRLLGLLLAFPIVGTAFFSMQSFVLGRHPLEIRELRSFFGALNHKFNSSLREVIVFVLVGVCAGLVVPLLGILNLEMYLASLPIPPEFVLFLCVLTSLSLAMIGISPLITATLVMEVFAHSDGLAVHRSLLIISATLTVGLSWLASPVGFGTMTVSRELKTPVREILIAWNLPYVLGALGLFGAISAAYSYL